MALGKTYANLVHDGDTSSLGLLVELPHGGRDVAGGDHILLVADGRLDDEGVESVRDQADDKVMLGNFGIEGLLVTDVERDRGREVDALGELLGGPEGSAGCRMSTSRYQISIELPGRPELEKAIISFLSSYTKENTHCCAILIFFLYRVMVCDDSKLKNLPRQNFWLRASESVGGVIQCQFR